MIENRILAEFRSALGIEPHLDPPADPRAGLPADPPVDPRAGLSIDPRAGLPAAPPPITLPSRLATTELALGSVAAVASTAAALAEARGVAPADWLVDPRRVAASFRGDQLLRLDGERLPGFAPLSGFFRTRDGWLRTHANYPHHRERLTTALGGEDIESRLAELTSLEAEELIRSHQGIAAAVRTPEQWRAHPQSAAVATLPLVALEHVASAPTRPTSMPDDADAVHPAAGLRVLDLTRVIAGPVATRTLALLGADVLRIDAPHLPEIASQHLDNGMGKRSATLDLRDPAQLRVLHHLLDAADVLVTGYRPHALDAFGLAPATLAETHPGLVIATLDAWGSVGPWSDLRGFDSIVQAATGISVLESIGDKSGDRPGALPAQALDHATGYLLAATVLHAVTRRLTEGGTWHVHAHLARTAHSLPALGGPAAAPPSTQPDLADCLAERQTRQGLLRYPLPALTLRTRSLDYPTVGGAWGTDEPRF
ncbi:MAG TPA: CoA transferase [Actinospica sp.]|nr:CoA transferase [Actinospica sp.]